MRTAGYLYLPKLHQDTGIKDIVARAKRLLQLLKSFRSTVHGEHSTTT